MTEVKQGDTLWEPTEEALERSKDWAQEAVESPLA